MRYNRFIITVVFFAGISYCLPLFLTSANSTPIIGQNISNNESTTNDSSTNFQISSTPDKVRVVASFYPIFEFVKRIGGDRVEVSSLIPVGIEPHDYEPTIQQVQDAQTANMLVINGAGFESGWVKDINPEFLLDTSLGLNLTRSDPESDQSVDPIFG
jgi:zinc transport system substrate-binding protein